MWVRFNTGEIVEDFVVLYKIEFKAPKFKWFYLICSRLHDVSSVKKWNFFYWNFFYNYRHTPLSVFPVQLTDWRSWPDSPSFERLFWTEVCFVCSPFVNAVQSYIRRVQPFRSPSAHTHQVCLVQTEPYQPVMPSSQLSFSSWGSWRLNARTVEPAKDIVPAGSRHNSWLQFVHHARKSLGLVSRVCHLLHICRNSSGTSWMLFHPSTSAFDNVDSINLKSLINTTTLVMSWQRSRELQ